MPLINGLLATAKTSVMVLPAQETAAICSPSHRLDNVTKDITDPRA